MSQFIHLAILGLLLSSTGFSQGVTQTVGAEGGTVLGPDGVTVTIAPGLKKPVRITIERISPARLTSRLKLNLGETVITPYYSISASEPVFIVNNSQPIEIRIPLPFGMRREEVFAAVNYWVANTPDVYQRKFLWTRDYIDHYTDYNGLISKLYDLDSKPITYVLVRRG